MKNANSTKLQAKSYIDCLAPDGPLTEAERLELAKYESVMRKGWDTILEWGEALTKIRDKRLYRETHPTFERYVRAQWDYGKSKAYYLIGAAGVVRNLSTVVDKPLPSHESQVRPLLGLSDEQAASTWKEAIVKAGSGKVTAKVVRDIAAKYLPKRSRKKRQAGPMPMAEVTVALSTVEAAELTLRAGKNIPQALKILAKVRGMLANYATKS